MSKQSVAVARSDALEQYAYAAVVNDADGMRRALARLDDARPSPTEPTAEVMEAFIASDPVGAATLGWVTFQELVDVVRQDPDTYLDEAEAAAFRDRGESVLRTVVAYRALGKPFGSETPDHAHLGRANYVLAARGSVLNKAALVQVLQEYGIAVDEGEADA